MRELEVLGAAARRDVDDAGALFLADVLPGDDPVLDALLAPASSSNGPAIAQADQLRAAQPADLLVGALEERRSSSGERM